MIKTLEIPLWLKNEILEYLIHSSQLHNNDFFCFEMEKWNKNKFNSLHYIGKEPIHARFCINDIMKWINIKTIINSKTYEVVFMKRYNTEFLQIQLTHNNKILELHINDILWIRNSFTGQKIIPSNDTKLKPYNGWTEFSQLKNEINELI
jgi:hypothetical protein